MAPRPPFVAALALGTAWWIFLDLGAVWGASLITIFGQAASTPPELMGLFALGCVVAAFPLHLLTRRGALPVLALVTALVARAVLSAGTGGEVQLWAASTGVAAALAWLAHLVVRHPRSVATGIACGWVLQSVVAAATGTWLPVWQGGYAGQLALWLLVALAVVTARAVLVDPAAVPERPSRRLAWSTMPVTLVAGVAVVNPGRASTVDPELGPVLLVVGCLVAAVVTAWLPPLLRSRTTRLAVGALGLLCVAASLWGTATVGGVDGVLVPWVLPVFVLGPTSLAVVLLPDRGGRPAGGAAVLGGAVLWVLLFFAYYAGYDLGYRADLLLVVVMLLLATTAAWCPVATGAAVTGARAVPGMRGVRGRGALVPIALGVTGLAVALVGAVVHRVPDVVVEHEGRELVVVAYNLRMGYGMDGRFDAAAVARVLDDADVALLSEVDRGWLLNGGQDQLAILARLTGKRLVFNPAADPVWGDAVLTDLPVKEVRGIPLGSYGAVTGAGALGVRVRVGEDDAWFVSTHVQPTAAREDGTIDQAGELAQLASELTADGTPLVLGGDFNVEPGTPSFDLLLGAGLSDALAEVRPLPTARSDDPDEQIDHVLHRTPWSVLDASAEESRASDHLPVRVVLDVGR